MVTGSYKWIFTEKESATFRVCVTDRLSPMAPHWHEEMEIMYFYKTEGLTYRCRGREIRISQGDLLIVNPRELHECADWGKNTVLACVMVDASRVLFPAMGSMHYRNVIAAGEQVKAVFEKLRQLLCERACNMDFKECMISSMMYELFAYLSELPEAVSPEALGEREDKIRSVLRYICEKSAGKITVQELAEKMNLSTDRFYHVFKEYTGVSPTEYIIAERMARACGMLLETERSVTDIALECGFCTSSYFCQRFLSYMGMTPREYRKNRQQAGFKMQYGGIRL